jgi:uncharacterized repeat protein (TIGR01451 family)
VNAATPNAATTCTGATLSGGAAGGNTIGITGGSIPAAGSCTVTVAVTSATAATYNNTTGTVTSTNAGTGLTAAASVTFTTKPTIAKSFSPAVVPLGTASTVTLVVTNNNTTVSLTALALADTLPAGMSVAATPALTNTCGGTVTGAFAGSGSVSLSGGAITLPATTCQITFNVSATPAGVYANTTGGATSNETGAAGPASNTASLVVMSAPTVAKSFSVASMGRGQTATLTITLANGNATAITGAAFTDTYPSNLVNAGTPNATTTCAGGSVTAVGGAGSVALSGATIPANGSCTVQVDVTSSTAATYNNTIAAGGVTSTNAPASTAAANASLVVNNTPTIAKSFSTNTGTGVTTLSLVITNTATSGGVSSLAFTDTFPSGLIVGATPALTNTCGGTVSGATSGSGAISLSGGSIAAAGGTCQITVAVTTNVQGIYDNTTTGVSSNLGTGSASNTATYIAPGLTKSFSPNTTGAGDVSRLTITIFNPSSTVALSGLTFSDTYPASVTNTATPAVANTCGGSVTGGAASGNTIGLTGGSLAAGATCSISVNVSASAVNSYYNQTGTVRSNQGVGIDAADTLYITSKPTITKSFAPASITVGSSSTMTIVIENNNGANSISALAFSDPFPAGLVVAATPALTNTCGGTITGGTAGSTTLSLAGGALAANATCTITIAVTSATAGTYSNQTNGATSTQTGATPGPRSNIAALTVNLQAPTVAKSFATSPIGINTDVAMTITLTNPNTSAITGVNFTDTYPAGLVNSGAPNLTSTCSGSATAAASTTSLALVGGTIPASGSCTLTVNVQSAAAGTYVNNTGAVTASNANTGASASASLTVLAPLTVVKSFGVGTVGPNVSTVMTISLTNPNAIAVTGVAFNDTYPAGLANTATPAGATTCTAGTVTAAASGTSLAFSGGTVPANAACTITVNVSSSTPGSYTNTLAAGAVTSANAGANTVAASGTLNVNASLTATKAFNPTSIGTGDTSVMTITFTNGNAQAVTGLAFTDNYPANLANTLSANAATTCGGTLTGVNTGNSVTLSGATVPANGSCTVTINTTSATAGTYNNSTGSITTTNAGTTAAASGTLTVLAHPVVTKSFSPSQIAANGTSTLTISLQNTNTVPVTGVAFTDTYPANLVNAATPAAASTCTGATVTAVAGAGSVALSGASIPANATCTVQVTVTPTTTGSFANTLAVGAVTSTNAGANTASATATLDALAPLTVAKAFGPATIGANGTSVLTVTLTNPNSLAVTGVAFTDTYPAGLANTGTPGGATTCTAGTVTAAASGTSLAFASGTVPANASCTVTVNVTAATPGSYTNTLAAGAVTATNTSANTAAASDTLTVLSTLGVAKSFSPASIGTNDTSVMTITLTNGNTTAVTGAALNDAYPAGLVNTASANASTTCGGTVTGTNNGSSLVLSGGTVPASSSCTITVNVTSASAGSYVNSTGGVSTTNAGTGASASGTLTVLSHPAIAKAFSPVQVAVNGTSTLTITLSNANATAITGAAFTDTYPAGLQNAATPGASSTCVGAGITANAGAGTIAVSGATIPANGSCTVQVDVTPTTTGSFVNTIAAGGLTSNNAGASTALATATLTAQNAPTATIAFTPANIAVNGTSVLTIVVTNPNATAIAGGAFTANYPAGLVNTASPSAAISGAGCVGTVSASAGGASFSLTGGTIPASSSCTYTVNVTSNTAGTYTSSTGVVTTTNSGNAAAVSASLRVFTAPTVTKAFAPTFVPTGGSSTMTITVTNPAANPANLTGVAISDTYPAGLANAAAGSVSCTSGSATLSGGANGGTSVGFTAGSIPPGATCTITQSVTTTANVTNTTSTATSNEAAAGTAASAQLSTSAAPTIDKQFSPATVAIGGTSTITFTLTNPNPIALTAGAFTDTLSGMQINATGAAGGTCAGAGGNNFTAGQTALSFSGLSVPASLSCTVTIVVRGTAVGANNNTSSGLSSSQAPTGAVSNTATLTVTATAPTITKSFSVSPINPGATSTLTVTISNANASAISITSVTDTFPAGLTVAATPNIANSCSGGSVTNTSGSVTLTGGSVAGSGSCAFSIDVTSSTAGAAHVNTIPVGALTTSAGSNAVAATATLDVRPEADLSITKSAPATVLSGASLTYTIVVTNSGPAAANGAAFSDSVPGVVTGVGAACGSATGGAVCGSVNVAGNAVTSTITTLPSGATVTFTITGTAPASGTFTNSASVTTPPGVADPTDPARSGAGNNTASANTTVVAPDLRVTSSHTGSFVVGSPGVYTLTVDNTLGTAATSGTITVTDTLPTGLTYASATGSGWSCSAVGQVVTCTSNAAIAAGATNPNAITLTVAVASTAVGTVTNTVAVSGGGEPAANTGNNSAFDSTLVSAAATNAFQPDNAQTGMPGTTVSYTHVFNAGSAGSVSFATSSVITPATPGWTQQVYRDTDCNGVLSAAEGATPLSGAVAVNPGDTVCIVVRDNIPAGAAYNAQAVITVTATFNGSINYTRTDVTTVGAAGGAGLTLAKAVRNLTLGTASGTFNTARPNDVLEYTITYTNTSSGPLSSIVITDATPSFTTYLAGSCGALPGNITACNVTTSPGAGNAGSIVWTLTGSLLSNNTGTVVYTVRVAP